MTAALDTLPTEVLDKIISLLHRSELRQLARVNRQFQPLAEARLYAHVGNNDLNPWRHPHSVAPDSMERRTNLLPALTGSKRRQSLVKSLSVKLYPFHARKTISNLLSLVAPSLTSLKLEETASYFPPPCFDDLSLSLAGIRLPSLKTLEVTTSFVNAAVFNQLLTGAPLLTSLILHRAVFPVHKKTLHPLLEGLKLDHLHTLRVEKMGLSDVPEVLKILQGSPNLMDVSLTSIAILRDHNCWIPIVNCLREMRIEKLEVEIGDHWDFEDGFSALKELTLRREHDRCYVPSFDHLLVPPLPSLELIRYVPFHPTGCSLSTPCRMSHYHGSSVPERAVSDVVPVPRPLQQQLEHAPNLKTLLFEPYDPQSIATSFGSRPSSPEKMDIIRSTSSVDGFECAIWCHVLIGDYGEEDHLDGVAGQRWRTGSGLQSLP